LGYPADASFIASWTYTVTRTLPNGNAETKANPVKVARDSHGRTYFDQGYWLRKGGAETLQSSFWVHDPVAHIDFFWPGLRNAVELRHQSDLNSSEEKEKLLKAPWVRTMWRVPACVAWDPDGLYEGGDYSKELLGTTEMFGITAEGFRATRVLPAGYKGYDQPVTVTEERWYSDELQITLLDVIEDPRVGKSIWQVTTLDRTEPDPALFRPPAGYQIVDVPQSNLRNSALQE
jgi:hypothetical protein